MKTYKHPTLCAFIESGIRKLESDGRLGTAKNHRAALNRLRRHLGRGDIALRRLDAKTIDRYQESLRREGLAPNTISFHMRILRAVYNRAVAQGLANDAQPFRNAYTATAKTRKRAISLADIRSIRSLDLSREPALALARDIFMFLFLCRGMPFVDAAFLRKDDTAGGAIAYRRHKTGQRLTVGIEKEIREIIARRQPKASPYLLPIIKKPGRNERRQYETALRLTNKRLKTIAQRAGIKSSLSTYVARHAWATIAKNKNIPIAVIADALGHASIRTTQIYLDAIDPQTIDKANKMIIKDL